MIMQRRTLTITAAFFLLFYYSATAQTSDTLAGQRADSLTSEVSSGPAVIYSPQQCVDSAIRNNLTVKTYDFTARTAKTARLQQYGNMLPTLSGYGNYYNAGGKSLDQANYTYINESQREGYYQLQGSFTLWNGGSLVNFVKQYSLAYEADKKDWQYQKDLITITVILDYLQVLSSEEQLNLAQAQAADIRHKADLTKIQDSLGVVAPSVYTDIMGQLNAAEVTIVMTKNTLEQNKLALATAMNIPYSPNMDVVKLNIDPTPVLYNATAAEVYQNATKNIASIAAADLHVASALKGVKANRGNMAPSLSLFYEVYTLYSNATTTSQLLNTFYAPDPGGSYVTVNGGQAPVYTEQANYAAPKVIPFGTQFRQNVYTEVGVQLNIPILNHLTYRVAYLNSKVNLAQAQFNQKTTIASLRQAVESNYVYMVQALRLYNTYYHQVKNYEESYREAKIKFDAGSLSSLDFVIYNTNKNQAQLSLIQAKYSFILQTKILDYFQGQLTW
jgi:outer membrane protein